MSTPWGLFPTNGAGDDCRMGTFSERLDQALADNGLTNADLARALDPSGQQKINKWRERNRVGMQSEKRVAELLPATNMHWLQHGIGDRLRSNALGDAEGTTPRSVNEPGRNYDVRQSLAARLDRVILAEALKALSIDEDVGGPYGLQTRADALIDFYDQLAAGADLAVLMARVTKARSLGGADGAKEGKRKGDSN